jgi:hypothetical protein
VAQTPRERLETRLGALKAERASWLTHWQELASYLLPRKSVWLGRTPANRGARQNTRIINGSPTQFLRTTTSGLIAGLTNPSTRWFRLQPSDKEAAEKEGVRLWLDQVETRLYEVMSAGRAYDAFASMYEDALVFGTAAMWHDEDRENVCRYEALTVGEFMLATDEAGLARIGYRELELTTSQMMEMFPGRCPQPVKDAYDKGNHEIFWPVCHAVEPMSRRVEGVPGARRWPYVSVYWSPIEKRNGGAEGFLRTGGYDECPLHTLRWWTRGRQPYGYSPGMDVLGDAKQLQGKEAEKAHLTNRISRGPLQGPISTKQLDLSPDALNEVPAGVDNSIRPIYVISPQAIQLVMNDIEVIQDRIRSGLFADLFLAFTHRTGQATQTRIADAERVDEKLQVLGPMLLRANGETYDPVIERTFSILMRASLPLWQAGQPAPLPAPPEALANADLDVEYVGKLQQALQQVKVEAINGVLMPVAQIAAIAPSILDKLDMDQVVDELAAAYGPPAGIVLSDEKVAEIRAQRQQAAQAKEQMMMMGEMAKAAGPAVGAMKDMAEMERGGGMPAPANAA